MQSSLNWLQIRPLNSSQQEGFEELVCQLARYEKAPEGSVFQRKGKPDGGVECFWIYPDGTEWGWQAKFFTNSPTPTQWGELKDSVKSFLTTHPKMTKYTVCFPIDLPDGRVKGQQSAREKWDEYVIAWQKEKKIDFEYWGSSELWNRLSLEEHQGRLSFWFSDQTIFTPKWFSNQIEETIANVGPRYTPEANVDLPITTLFDGLGRTENFYKRLKELGLNIFQTAPKERNSSDLSSEITNHLTELHHRTEKLYQTLISIDDQSVKPLDWNQIIHRINDIQEQTEVCEKSLFGSHQSIDAFQKNKSYDHQKERNSSLLYALRQFNQALNSLDQFVKSEEALSANTCALLVSGEAGKGKTHLFCDIARQRTNLALPTILLLGGHFKGNIWPQILELLNLPRYSREELLGALESTAQVRGRKAMILIDALNDTPDITIWFKGLNGFLSVLKRYKWISVAISVRSTYKDFLIPPDINQNLLTSIEHQGFGDVAYEASSRFFNYYGITQPSIPFLNPEFQTPLFLKIFCDSLRKQNITIPPKGNRGISKIFKFFIDSIFKQLQLPEKLNLTPNLNLVQKSIDQLAATMADRMTYWLPVSEAEDIVNSNLNQTGYTNSLFFSLLSEGLLVEDLFFNQENKLIKGVSFAYQRLTDHLLASNILDRYLNSIDENTTNLNLGKVIPTNIDTQITRKLESPSFKNQPFRQYINSSVVF